MSLSITISNQIKCYNLSVCPTVPQFFEEAKRSHKSLKHDELFKKRIEVIQDFEFPTAATQVEESQDGDYIVASGVYAPSIKIYETRQLSMKCLRGLDSDCVRFCLLTPDYKKIAIAGSDRSIELHAQYGRHYKTRVPRVPTGMVYVPRTCDLIISSSSNELIRLSLEQGQFLSPIDLISENQVNCLHYDETLNLIYSGAQQSIQIVDYRQRQICSSLKSQNPVTALSTLDLMVAVGHDNGLIKVYDVRQNQPLYTMQHQYRLPIKQVMLEDTNGLLISADSKIIKFYSLKKNGQLFTSRTYYFYPLLSDIEPSNEINQFCKIKGSGLFLVAQEQPRIGLYFLPQLDPAPKWCPFLDNLTEELEEEETQIVYDDFKFITYDDLQELDAVHLLETKMVKPYMHGYLIHLRLYNKLSVDKGFNYENHKQKIINQTLENETQIERQEHGYLAEKQKQVNEDYFDELKKKQTLLTEVKIQKIIKFIQQDGRFKKIFIEEDYKIDKNSEHWKRLHPSQAYKIQQNNVNDEIQDEDEEAQQEKFKKFSTKKIKKTSHHKKTERKGNQV